MMSHMFPLKDYRLPSAEAISLLSVQLMGAWTVWVATRHWMFD